MATVKVLTFVIESDEEDGGYVASTVGESGITSQGETLEDALVNVAEAYREAHGGDGRLGVSMSGWGLAHDDLPQTITMTFNGETARYTMDSQDVDDRPYSVSTRCSECGRYTPPWKTSSQLWAIVMGTPYGTSICIPCFIHKADECEDQPEAHTWYLYPLSSGEHEVPYQGGDRGYDDLVYGPGAAGLVGESENG